MRFAGRRLSTALGLAALACSVSPHLASAQLAESEKVVGAPAAATESRPVEAPADVQPGSVQPTPLLAPATPAPVAIPAVAEPPKSIEPSKDALVEPAKPVATEAPPALAPAAPAKAEIPATETPAPAAKSALNLDIGAAAAKLAVNAKGAEAKDRDAVVAFYGARDGSPLWVSQDGLNADGKAVAATLRNAGDYGLEAAAFDLKTLRAPIGGPASADALAAEEAELSLAILKYARHARGGRVQPTAVSKYLDRAPTLFEPRSILDQIAQAQEPGSYLKSLHPQHPQFERLRQKYLAMRRNGATSVALAKVPEGPRIEPGSTHPHVVLVRARLGLAAETKESGDETAYDDTLVKAVTGFQSANGIKPANGVIEKSTRVALNTVAVGNPKKLLVNLEQWRWMPPDLGNFYVWVNVPEYMLRVVQNGTVIHSERVIVGKTDSQTPIFSDEMEQVIFHPFWGVPDSIKQLEILPSLKSGSQSALIKHNLKIQSGGRDIDPKSVDWTTTDIRKFHVYQPPGNDNVLGVVKFRFPNKHDVYMHDTPSKSLFNASVRAYSHGCMRVKNPLRLAELLLAEDKKMSSDRVRSLAAPEAAPNNQINLTRKLPVHVTYFTAAVEDDGKTRYFNDIYGHEERIALGIEGKVHLVKAVPEPQDRVRAEPVARLAETKTGGAPLRDWARNVFGGN